jgi:hypothetical protein
LKTLILCLSFLLSLSAFAKPYHLSGEIILPPKAEIFDDAINKEASAVQAEGLPVLRIDVEWDSSETYKISSVQIENSGTPVLYESAKKTDLLGSYKGSLTLGNNIYYSSVGTGKEYRKLVRTVSFRFPYPAQDSSPKFSLTVEHPISGEQVKAIEVKIDPSQIKMLPVQKIKVTSIREAKVHPSLKLVLYAEGYTDNSEETFLKDARRVVTTFEQNFPGHEVFEFIAVFAPSQLPLGSAKDLGFPVKTRDSFLGLYYPYWNKFGRWYNIVYPTNETYFRNALGQVAYDYPFGVINDGNYWGIGNYKAFTAIPARSKYFEYMILHEFGHFMGLNEEYEGGGRTELEFAPQMKEPWSQNITFNPNADTIKWKGLLTPGIAVPTSQDEYTRMGGSSVNPVGAYKGGYADSLTAKSHKPVLKCTMSIGGGYCSVCKDGMKKVIQFDTAQ